MSQLAIYQPKGKAAEYSRWACNLYVGCNNDCFYCYCKRGVLGTVMGAPRATLKSCFKDKTEAYETFLKELSRHEKEIIRDGGLLFSFTTDPCLPETIDLTFCCIESALYKNVPCRILTKRADWILGQRHYINYIKWFENSPMTNLLTVGFTLTGCDELEPGASTNQDRIAAMRLLYGKGFKTWASIEPVIDFDRSMEMIRQSLDCCNEYRIGLLSGNRHAYDRYDMSKSLPTFVDAVNELVKRFGTAKVYWKDSVNKELKKYVK